MYGDYEWTFEELLEKYGSFTIHHYNIQTLCIELYKVYHDLSQTISSELFKRNNSTYNLWSKSDLPFLKLEQFLKDLASSAITVQ